MKKILKDDFNKLLKKYKTLSAEKFEMEHEILKSYESLIVDNVITITSETLKTIESQRERLNTVKQEMKKTDKKILKIFKNN
jgi:prephenate dehydrogenase